MIRLVEIDDINELAPIYKDLFDDADIGEEWTLDRAKDLLLYWYEKQKDLFLVDVEDGKAVGAIVSGVKSWFDGMRLVDTELFVSKRYQNSHIGSNLMLEHLKKAKFKYDVKKIEFHTFGNEEEFPQKWYRKLGFKKVEELIIMEADVEEVLNNIGYFDEDNDLYHQLSYNDLSSLYEELHKQDNAFIFDMLPAYAYIDSNEERKYIESRITAMKNGANVKLFIVGDEDRFNSLKNNELFDYTLKSCYGISKIYILKAKDLKEKCLEEYYQLGYGLYYGEYSNGKKEVFRDLWCCKNNIGVLFKNHEIIAYMENVAQRILDKVENGELENLYNKFV